MNGIMAKRNRLLADKTIKGLQSRNMSGYYAEDKAEALRIALGLIPEKSSITMGGCMSAEVQTRAGTTSRLLISVHLMFFHRFSSIQQAQRQHSQ